jgi:hypothetical protein
VLPTERMVEKLSGSLVITHFASKHCTGKIEYSEKVSLAACLPAWSKHQPELVDTYFKYAVKIGVKNPFAISTVRVRYADAACTTYLYSNNDQQHSKVFKHFKDGCEPSS